MIVFLFVLELKFKSILISTDRWKKIDAVPYSWDGAQLQSMTAQANGSDYYGRTGFPLSATGGTADFVFDAAGQLVMDSSRGIIDITYNRQGLPIQVTFEDGSRVIYTYSYSGELLSMKAYNKTQITSTRDYCGDFIFENGALSMVNFPGGYFDSDGNPTSRHTDWQGNVTMVTNSEGKIAQHTGYYPYGEPWSEPSGQPYLYGGKERLREGGLNEYDFGARRYNSALALWTTPDPVVHDQHSPYTYCAGNPIKFIDPTGRNGELLYSNESIILRSRIYTTEKSKKSAEYGSKGANQSSIGIIFTAKDSETGEDIELPFIIESEVITIEFDGNSERSSISKYIINDDIGIGLIVEPDGSLDSEDVKGVNGRTLDRNLCLITESRAESDTSTHEQLHGMGLNHHKSGVMTTTETDKKRNPLLDPKGVLKDLQKMIKDPQRTNTILNITEKLRYDPNTIKLKDK